MRLCVISVSIVLNCEKTCLLGNTAVVAQDQKGRKMGAEIKDSMCVCTGAFVNKVCLCTPVRVLHVSVVASMWGRLA